MPIYEYRCGACDHYLDALQKISDEPLRECPACGASALKRQMSAPSFRLKGSGWYETDFKSDKDRKRNLVESGEKTKESGGKDSASEGQSDNKSESKSDSKTDSKPDSKSDSKSDTKADAKKPAAESAPKAGKKGSGSEAA
jgi:putative FmdB family regulatory protein